jgi:hypothetical protein
VGDVVACHHRNPRWQTEKADGVARAAGLTGECVDEEAAAHAHSAVDAPHGELDPLLLQRLVPGENMLVDAVDEGAVDVEEHGRRATRPTHRVRNRGVGRPYADYRRGDHPEAPRRLDRRDVDRRCPV